MKAKEDSADGINSMYLGDDDQISEEESDGSSMNISNVNEFIHDQSNDEVQDNINNSKMITVKTIIR